MLIVMTSPDAIAPSGSPDGTVVSALIQATKQGHPVGVLSNHKKPAWFDGVFAGSAVQFLAAPGRQSGAIVAHNADNFKLKPHDVVVLAAKDEDIQMGKNGGAVIVGAGWSKSAQVARLGIAAANAAQLTEVIELMAGWSGHWWFQGGQPLYAVRALMDLSSLGAVSHAQVGFAKRLVSVVKAGGARLNALLAVTARSLLMDGVGNIADLVWGVYPSSQAAVGDSQVLTDFTHRLRTTVSRVRFAKVGEPLFIRHSNSPKRSAGGGGSRFDPTDQLTTLHLNPFYQESGRLAGKNVMVVDDCTTYGVSFGVASALLLKAGAASVTGVALGKFGGKLSYYDIDINANPFAPMGEADFKVKSVVPFPGKVDPQAQQDLRALIP